MHKAKTHADALKAELEQVKSVNKNEQKTLSKKLKEAQNRQHELEAEQETLKASGKNEQETFLQSLSAAKDRQHELEAELGNVKFSAKEDSAKIKKLEDDLEKIVLENNTLLKESKDYFDEIEHLRKQISFLHQKKAEKKKMQHSKTEKNTVVPVASNGSKPKELRQLQKWKKESIELRNSYSFRLGQILINTVLKPGKNTLLMPYYLTQLVWDIFTGRGRRKTKQAIEDQLN